MYLQKNRGDPLIRFVNICKNFGSKKVLNNINFSIYEGEFFGLIGSSGAGKTTLLRTLIGYISPDSGKIFYAGKDITNNPELIRNLFGFATQDNCFYDELSLLENVKYFGTLYGVSSKEIKERTEYLLKLVKLWDYKNLHANKLSGGMKRRLDLCISLIHKPKILILDEPTAGLDPLLRKEMWHLIKQINESGVNVIMSSHLLDEMEYLCDDVAMIKNGSVLVKGSPEQLKTFYSKNQEVTLETHPGNYRLLINELKSKGIPIYYPRHEDMKLVFYTEDPYPLLKVISGATITTREKLKEIKIEKPNLSEVFEAFSSVK